MCLVTGPVQKGAGQSMPGSISLNQSSLSLSDVRTSQRPTDAKAGEATIFPMPSFLSCA